MGREIRRVPPNWEHPRDYLDKFMPMCDESAQDVWDEWIGNWEKIKALPREQQVRELLIEEDSKLSLYEEFCSYYGTSPNPDYYRPNWTKEEATWYQVYETVSDGTPVTPPFATTDELIYYLVNNGTFWDSRGWSVEAATNFVEKSGWVPSMAVIGGRSIDLTQEIL